MRGKTSSEMSELMNKIISSKKRLIQTLNALIVEAQKENNNISIQELYWKIGEYLCFEELSDFPSIAMDKIVDFINYCRADGFTASATINMLSNEVPIHDFDEQILTKLSSYISTDVARKVIERNPDILAKDSYVNINARMHNIVSNGFKKEQIEQLLLMDPLLLKARNMESRLEKVLEKNNIRAPKEFDLETIISITSGHLYTDIEKVTFAINYLLSSLNNANILGIEFYKVLEIVKRELSEKFPQLKGLGVDEKFESQEDIQNYIATKKRNWGAMYKLEPLNPELIYEIMLSRAEEKPKR